MVEVGVVGTGCAVPGLGCTDVGCRVYGVLRRVQGRVQRRGLLSC